MRFESHGTALLMNPLGPAGLALKAQRLQGRAYLTNPRAATRMIRGGSSGYLGALGQGPSTTATLEQAGKSTAISVGAGYAGGAIAGAAFGTAAGAGGAAAGAAAGATAGSVVPVVGTIIGAVIGLAVGALLKKNYLNVQEMNANEDQEVAAFKQYQQIMGQAAGRHFGLDVMTVVFKGALHSGFFPGNMVKQCFHNGCSKWPGRADYVDAVVNEQHGKYPDPNSLPKLLPKFLAYKNQQGGSMTPANLPAYGATNRIAMAGRGRLRGLGALGALAKPDAVVFVDQFLIPAQGNSWVVPANPTAHQVLYDVADAFLAANNVPSVPYIPKPAAAAPVAVVAATPGTQIVPTTPGSTGSPGYNYEGATDVGGGYTYTPVTNPVTGQTTYQATPTGGALTAGISALPSWSWLVVAAGLAFALARPETAHHKRRHR